jgi:hypothetical protein
MDALPPFAIGPHYVVGADGARAVARGSRAGALAGVGTLEDVSVTARTLALIAARASLRRRR